MRTKLLGILIALTLLTGCEAGSPPLPGDFSVTGDISGGAGNFTALTVNGHTVDIFRVYSVLYPTGNGSAYYSNNGTFSVPAVEWADNTTTPSNKVSPLAWLPIKLPDGTTAYIPAYK